MPDRPLTPAAAQLPADPFDLARWYWDARLGHLIVFAQEGA